MRKLILNKKRHLFVGIDPGFSSTGIVGLTEEGKVRFSLALTMQKGKARKSVFLKHRNQIIDNHFEKNVKIESISFKYETFCSEQQFDLQQMIAYYYSFGRMLGSLYAACLEDTVMFAVEIPRMAHQGSGAKIERAFTSVLINLAELYEENLLKYCRTVTPGEVKKFVTGKANTKKELVLKEVYKRYGFDTDINDVADAYAIARYLRYLKIGEK